MNWYYAHDNQQDGPHSDEAFQALVSSGQVTPSTLVWREGLANWAPLSQAAPQFLPPQAAAAPPLLAPAGKCVECGGSFPTSELIPVGGATVCARCKPLRLQKLQEGAPLGGVREDLQRLLKIAKAQRGVNLAMLFTLAGYALLMSGGFAVPANGRGPGSPFLLVSVIGGTVILVAVVLQIIYVYRLAAALGHTAIAWVLGVVFLSCIGLVLLLVLSSKATKELRNAGFKVGLLGGNPKEIENQILAESGNPAHRP